MRRWTMMLAFSAVLPLFAHADDRGISQIKVRSLLDDSCGVWINGTLRVRLEPMGESQWLVANPDTVYRTNILVRCADGGVYGTSIEAIYSACEFEIDEEGGGLRTVSCR